MQIKYVGRHKKIKTHFGYFEKDKPKAVSDYIAIQLLTKGGKSWEPHGESSPKVKEEMAKTDVKQKEKKALLKSGGKEPNKK